MGIEKVQFIVVIKGVTNEGNDQAKCIDGSIIKGWTGGSF